MSLDKIDERIVAALIEDARASYATIGALVGLSAPAVKRRVDRLQESGAIRGFGAGGPGGARLDDRGVRRAVLPRA